MNKYRARKTIYNGKKYDSRKEARRAFELSLLEKAGIITDLEEQIPYVLQEKFKYMGKTERAIKYVADFRYRIARSEEFPCNMTLYKGDVVVEDVKGMRTQIYKLKRKLLLKKYPDIIFIET